MASKNARRALLGLFVVMFVLPLMMLFGVASTKIESSGGGSGGSGSSRNVTGVPNEYKELVIAAGSRCAAITPSLIAAQIEAESNWNPNAKSDAGAQGISQFMPDTWASVGEDFNKDGKIDVWDPADAIPTQGKYMCDLAAQVEFHLKSGDIKGNIVELTLASYNAGLGNVLNAGGIPNFPETIKYVQRILEFKAKYDAPDNGGGKGDDIDPGDYPPEPQIYEDPTPGSEHAGKVTARTYRMITTVMQKYPQIKTPSLYCWDAHPANPTSDHPMGRACDIPFYGCDQGNLDASNDPLTGKAAGNEAAQWLISNAKSFGISYIIWQGRIWEPGKGWYAYDGAGGIYNPNDCSGGHYDHIHVSVF